MRPLTGRGPPAYGPRPARLLTKKWPRHGTLLLLVFCFFRLLLLPLLLRLLLLLQRWFVLVLLHDHDVRRGASSCLLSASFCLAPRAQANSVKLGFSARPASTAAYACRVGNPGGNT